MWAFNIGFGLESDQMIQTIRKKLSDHRLRIAWLAGASPLILTFGLGYYITPSPISHDTALAHYLVQHQDDIFQSLIVSSVIVAVFCTMLRNTGVAFLAALQPAVIQVAYISTDSSQDIFRSILITAITVVPVLFLLITLRNEVGQASDQDKEEKIIDSEEQDTGT